MSVVGVELQHNISANTKIHKMYWNWFTETNSVQLQKPSITIP